MTDFSLDKTGNARLALEDIFRDYGLTGLDDDKLLSQVLPDLLSGAPREAALVQAAGGARVGRLLTERVNASIPTEAAVRDVAAILTERTAFDSTACLWVVSEYAHAIGHPVDIATAPDTSGSGGAGEAGGSGGPGTRYTPGRYTPGQYVPRPPDIEKTIPTDILYAPPPRPNRVPLVVGIIVAAVVLCAGTAVAYTLWFKPACQGAGCKAGPSPSTAVSPTLTSPSPTSPTPTPPSPTPTVTVTVGTIVPALSTVMPRDLNVRDARVCTTASKLPHVNDVVSSYSCVESARSTMPGMRVWGYQFGSQASFANGVTAFNAFVIHFDIAAAGTECPPQTSASGYGTWHRNDKPDVVLGNIECYPDTKGHDYVWTDFTEYTIMVAVTTSSQSFSRLESWWEANNNNSRSV